MDMSPTATSSGAAATTSQAMGGMGGMGGSCKISVSRPSTTLSSPSQSKSQSH